MEEKAKFEETFQLDPKKALEFLGSRPGKLDSELNIVIEKYKKQSTNSFKKEGQTEKSQAPEITQSPSRLTSCASKISVDSKDSLNKMGPLPKSSKENLKPDSAPSQQQQPQRDRQAQQQRTSQQQTQPTQSQHNARNQKGQQSQQQQQQQVQKQQGQGQQKQSTNGRAVNGKSSGAPSSTKTISSSNTNHTTSNGKPYPLSTSSNGMTNGQIVSGVCDTSSKPSSGMAVASAPITKGPSAKPLVMDSPGTGSGSSASQSPSCGTKAVDQVS